MTESPIYRMREPDSDEFTHVRLIRQYRANAGASNFQIAVADVEIVETGEQLKEIPVERLTLESE